MSADTQPQVVFTLEKIYLKDASFEAPNTPQVFLEETAPEVSVQLDIEHQMLNREEGLFEVVLVAVVSAKLKDKTVFLTEIKQAGLFHIQGVPEPELPKVLQIACPNILLPFVREVVNSLVGKGGFPQLLLNPINFEGLYQQKQAAKA